MKTEEFLLKRLQIIEKTIKCNTEQKQWKNSKEKIALQIRRDELKYILEMGN